MALVLKEGILANNDILSETEFRDFINPILDERLLHNLNLRLNSILKFLTLYAIEDVPCQYIKQLVASVKVCPYKSELGEVYVIDTSTLFVSVIVL